MRGMAVLFVGAGLVVSILAFVLGTESDPAARTEDVRAAERGSSGFLAPPATPRDGLMAQAPPRAGSGGPLAPPTDYLPPERAAQETASEPEPAVLTPQPEPAAVVDAAPLDPPGDTAPPRTSAAPSDRAASASPSGQPLEERAGDEVDPFADWSFDPDRDVELAAALAHGSARGLAEVVTARGDEIPDARKRFLLAFCNALVGRPDAEDLVDEDSVSAVELELLSAARGEVGLGRVSAEEARAGALSQAMRMALLEREARRALREGDAAAAAGLYSDLLLEEVASPWREDIEALGRWTEGLREAQRGHRWNRKGEWPSITVEVGRGDSLVLIRKRVLQQHPELLLCTGLIDRVNQLGGGYIHPGDELRIPTDEAWALVDLSARWAFYLLGDEVAAAWHVGIGKEGHDTELGTFVVGEKQEEPMWFRPGQDPVPFGDPSNPLGTRWIGWYRENRPSSLGFHGTSDPDGVGGRVSLGCIRMHNEDVEELFEILPLQARVFVQP